MCINHQGSSTLVLFIISLVFLLVQVPYVNAIPKIEAVGSKFFNEDGERFFIKGIAYQLTPSDPLIQTRQCKRDATLMKEVGANAIRVYHVDPDGDHSGCMKAFADNGIYLFVDLDDFPTQIEQDSPNFDKRQLEAFEKTMKEFQNFDNTAGVFVGNEVITTSNGSQAAPYILSAVRYIKGWQAKAGRRQIPVGYSAADIAELRPMLQDYLICRPEPMERLDFFALNAYEWCGDSSYNESGYSLLQEQAKEYPVPIFFSETGCNTHRPRDFQDLNAIYSSPMSDVWSGAIVYEWLQEANDYGLVTYAQSPKKDEDEDEGQDPLPITVAMGGFSRYGTPTPILPDFTNLKSRWDTLTPTDVPVTSGVTPTGSFNSHPCPEQTSGGWNVDPSATLPTLGQAMSKHTTEKPTETATTNGPTATAVTTQKNSASQLLQAESSTRSNVLSVMLGGLFGLGGLIGWWL